MRACARLSSSLSVAALALALAGCASANAPRRVARAARTEAWVSSAEMRVDPVDAVYPASAVRRVTIGASGDILLHLKVIRAASEHTDQGGFAHVFDALRAIIGPDEVAFANLETPLSDRIEAVTGAEPVLGAPPEVASALRAAGVDVVSVANNHAYDQTAAGMDDTLRALAAADVRAVGAAGDEWSAPGPVIVERNGVRVALVAYTVRLNRGAGVVDEPYARIARDEDATLVAALARARERADVVVLSIHWSGDFVRAPLARQRVRARELVDAGADLILGHGPHVLQEVERLASPRGDALVAYSLGNLVSNQALRYRRGHRVRLPHHPATILPALRDGVWLRTSFRLEDGRIAIDSIEGVPLWTHNNFLELSEGREPRLDIRVEPLREVEEGLQRERRRAIGAALGSSVRLLD